MSYPIHKKKGTSAPRSTRTEKGFWGLDLSEDLSNRSFAKAVDTENMIWDGEGLKVRSGYRRLADFSGRINGIFHYGDSVVVHAGTNLYHYDAAVSDEPSLLWEKMADAPSSGVIRRQTITHRTPRNHLIHGWKREEITGDFLFIIDGKNYLFFDGKEAHSIIDPYWGEDVIGMIYDEKIYPDYYSTVPFTTVAKLPAGGGDTDPRGDNRLSQFRCESFYVDETETTGFYLTCPYDAFLERIPEEILIRDDLGCWRNLRDHAASDVYRTPDGRVRLELPKIAAGMNFMLSDDGNAINVGIGGERMVANDGMDNYRIIYAVKKEYPTELSGATVRGTYGPDGKDNVLFLGGSSSKPGVDFFSTPDDFSCFYETSYEILGNSKTPVTGYCRLKDGRLAVLKNDDTQAGVYFRSHAVVELGMTQSGAAYKADAYPSVSGAAVAGCISPFSVGVAGNEPCYLSTEGLFSIRSVSDELINLNEAVRRSRPIDSFLQKQNLSMVRSICWRGFYLLAFGNEALLTDGVLDPSGSYRFLKWRFSHPVTALSCKEGTLWLGSEDGGVFWMDPTASADDGILCEAFWQTPVLEDAGGKKLLVRKAHAACTAAPFGELSAIVYRDGCPEPCRKYSLQLPDFSNWDFGNISFSGRKEPEWISLLSRSVSVDKLSFRFILQGNEAPLLWGVRISYEKGGWIK